MPSDRSWMTAAEAARVLQVSRATLYAYVSRGRIRSASRPGATRERRYSRDDVERLRRRSAGRRDPDKAAEETLRWGMPILESSITAIADNRLFYRGHDAVALARTRSVAAVASLVWTGGFDAAFGAPPSRMLVEPRAPVALPFVSAAQARLARAAAGDPLACDLRPLSVAATGWRILTLLTAVAARSAVPQPAVERTLARAWKAAAPAADVLRQALILSADHELNVSSFTARCVASAGSNPYAVVLAGLAALEGTRHGGLTGRVEAMLHAVRPARRVGQALADRLRRGEAIDGFGHPLYRDGDPRADALLSLLRERYPRSAELRFVLAAADAASSLLGEPPTIDFALAAVARVLRLPAGAPLVLFAIGRTIGWIGHAIEQYASGQIIRPRAKYVGERPLLDTIGAVAAG